MLFLQLYLYGKNYLLILSIKYSILNLFFKYCLQNILKNINKLKILFSKIQLQHTFPLD